MYDSSASACTVAIVDVSITELRANLAAHLARVKDGEKITITERGKPIAVLGPADEEARWADLEARGIIGPKPTAPEVDWDSIEPIKLLGGWTSEDLMREARGE